MGKLARLKESVMVTNPFTKNTNEVTPDDELSLLDKKGDKFIFCVRKMHGTGASGLELTEDEFEWVETKSAKT
jgi:hypothetical protein